MKKLITLLTVVAAGFTLSPATADARDRHHHRPADRVYVSGHTSCGCPVYTKKTFCHFDRYGRAVYTYHKQTVKHRCHRYDRHRSHWKHGRYGNRHYRGHGGHGHVSFRTPVGRVSICR